MFYFFLKLILGPIFRLLWISSVDGLKNVPKSGGLIVASNHESYFDFLCLSAIFPRRLYFLAGEVFFKKWYWRPLVKWTGQIRVDRDQKDKSKSTDRALKVLAQKKVLGIFPEGTRSSDGELQRAYTGVAKLALMAKVPVLPVGIIGTFEIMSRHDKKPHFDKKCQIKIGEPIDLSQYYDQEDDKEVLTYITHRIIMPKIAELAEEEYGF